MRRAGRRATRRTTRRVMRRTRRRFIRRTVLVGGMVVLAAAGTSAAIKLSQRDAQRIEEHTGLPPQDLEDEDLNQAMQELNITPQTLTPEDEAALTQQTFAPAESSQTPGVPTSVSSTRSQDYIAELEQLADLRDKGIINSEEFEAKKKQLLGL